MPYPSTHEGVAFEVASRLGEVDNHPVANSVLYGTGTGASTWLPSPVVNVKAYGATGDGSTNDTAAIQAAIDAAEALSPASGRGATVFFPAGIYAVASTLTVEKDNIILQGVGRQWTTGGTAAGEAATPATGGSIIRPTGSFSGSWVIDCSQTGTEAHALGGVWIKDLAIDGFFIPAGTTGGVLFKVFRGGITGCDFTRIGQNGATGPIVQFQCVDDVTTWPKGAFDCLFSDCVFAGGGGVGFYAPGPASDSMIQNCIIQDCASYGIHLVGPGFVVSNNYITGHNAVGVYSEGRENYIVGNRFRECYGGVEFAGTGGGVSWGGAFSIVGNAFRNCSEGGDNTNDAIKINFSTNSQTGGVIAGNDFEVLGSNGTLRYRYCINIATAQCVDVEVGPHGAGYNSGTRTAAYGTAFINDAGTNTRFVSGRKIAVRTTDASNADIIVEGTANSSQARLSVFGKSGAGVIAQAVVQSGSDGIAYFGTLNNTTCHLIQNSGARITLNQSGDVSFSDTVDLVFATATGSKIGTGTTEKIAFHNATPVVQRAGAAQAAVATTAATQTTPWGFSTQAQADAIVTLVNEIRAALVEKGLIKGAA